MNFKFNFTVIVSEIAMMGQMGHRHECKIEEWYTTVQTKSFLEYT